MVQGDNLMADEWKTNMVIENNKLKEQRRILGQKVATLIKNLEDVTESDNPYDTAWKALEAAR